MKFKQLRQALPGFSPPPPPHTHTHTYTCTRVCTQNVKFMFCMLLMVVTIVNSRYWHIEFIYVKYFYVDTVKSLILNGCRRFFFFCGLLDCYSFFKTFQGWHATFSVYRRVITSTVALLINFCLHYLLWVELLPLRAFVSRGTFPVPNNHR
jgi:hypothetical protein